jgi:hypothetical protein
MDADCTIVARWYAATDWSSECWRINSTQYSPQGAQKRGYRYLAPVAPPDLVRELVEALKAVENPAMTMGETLTLIRAALARAKESGI